MTHPDQTAGLPVTAELIDAPLRVIDLTRRYDELVAVSNLSFEVHASEIVALLGKNGAGKSTTVRAVAGLDGVESGHILVGGAEPRVAVKRAWIGYCSQDIALYLTRPVIENLVFFANLSGLAAGEIGDAVDRAVDELGLHEVRRKPVSSLSGGFRRRVHVAAAMIAPARLLILDEPTAGVDIESREAILDAVRARAATGTGILYTSHDLSDVERLCDRVVILDHGSCCAAGTVSDLAASIGEVARIEFESRTDRDIAAGVLKVDYALREWGGSGLTVEFEPTQNASILVNTLDAGEWQIRRIALVPRGLESVFLRVTREGDQ